MVSPIEVHIVNCNAWTESIAAIVAADTANCYSIGSGLVPLTRPRSCTFTCRSLFLFLCIFSAPKLNYTILFNSSRALKFQQLIFGSPNKPDGRVGMYF